MDLRSRRELLSSLIVFGMGVLTAGPIGYLVDSEVGSKEKGKFFLRLGDNEWEVPVRKEGEPLISVLSNYFKVGFLDGPWSDGSEGKLLVYIEDQNGEVLAGEDLELVINRRYLPNLTIELLAVFPGILFEIDKRERLAERYTFFDLEHS